MKLIAGCCIAILILSSMALPQQAAADTEPGGTGAFFIGCCLGLRVGLEYNEGADVHWREWCRLIPYANIVFMIWDGVECQQGMTAHEWAEKNAANWY